MSNVTARIEKAKKQLDATAGVLAALASNLQEAYAQVKDQLVYNPGDAHLTTAQSQLDQMIGLFGATVSETLLTVGIRSIASEDVVRAVKRL